MRESIEVCCTYHLLRTYVAIRGATLTIFHFKKVKYSNFTLMTKVKLENNFFGPFIKI